MSRTIFESGSELHFVFRVWILNYAVWDRAHAIVRRIAAMLPSWGDGVGPSGGGADISGAMREGVPGGSIRTTANAEFESPVTRGPEANVDVCACPHALRLPVLRCCAWRATYFSRLPVECCAAAL